MKQNQEYKLKFSELFLAKGKNGKCILVVIPKSLVGAEYGVPNAITGDIITKKQVETNFVPVSKFIKLSSDIFQLNQEQLKKVYHFFNQKSMLEKIDNYFIELGHHYLEIAQEKAKIKDLENNFEKVKLDDLVK